MLKQSEIVNHYNTDLYKCHKLLRKLDDFRKLIEAGELYESCAMIRDMIRDLSDYILGYRKFDDRILHVQMYATKYFGILIDQGDNWSLWNIDDYYLYFDVNEDAVNKTIYIK